MSVCGYLSWLSTGRTSLLCEPDVEWGRRSYDSGKNVYWNIFTISVPSASDGFANTRSISADSSHENLENQFSKKHNHLWELTAFLKSPGCNLKIFFFFAKILLVGSIFSTVALVPAGDVFPTRLNRQFPFEVCSLYGFAAKSPGAFYS